MLASILHTVWTDVFWGHGYTGYGSIPRAIVFDVFLLVALVLLIPRGIRRLRERGNRPEGSASEVGAIASGLNPLHHEPLPPFPGTPDEHAK